MSNSVKLTAEYQDLANNQVSIAKVSDYLMKLCWDQDMNPTGINVQMIGNPGIGKTAVVKQLMSRLKEKHPEAIEIYLTTSHMDPTDLSGIPYIETTESGEKITKYAVPSFLPRDPNTVGVLFLDEISNAAGSVLNVCQQLIQERRIGEYHLPDGVVVIAASNPTTQNSYSNELSMPMKNRFCNIFVTTNSDDWSKYFLKTNQNVNNKVKSLILGFINQDPTRLEDVDSMDAKKFNFATPRQWEKFAKVLNNVNLNNRDEIGFLASAFIGSANGQMFASYTQDAGRYQDPMEIIEGKPFTCGDDSLGFYYTLYSVVTKLVEWQNTKVDSNKIDKGVKNLKKAVKGLGDNSKLAPTIQKLINELSDHIDIDEIAEDAELINATKKANGAIEY